MTGGATGLGVRWPRRAQLALLLHNNAHNLQIPISSVNLTLTWGQGPAGAWDPAPRPTNAPCENIWARRLSDGGVALALVNQGANSSITCNATCFAAAGLRTAKRIRVRDMLAHEDLPDLSPPFVLTARVPGQGAVAAFRLTPLAYA